ncbi:MAG: DinB family protein [Candidatus Heimdallarchaeota archaeon]|nr:DinB family protein [Candidatus Heimdallarchaeota archaeon]
MKDFELLKSNYLKLRNVFINYLDKFDFESYYYQPTEKSNTTAWIVPHIAAFEKVMVTNKILGFDFKEFISDEDVEKYKPTVDGFIFTKDQMMTKEEAIRLLKTIQEVSIEFLDNMINQTELIINVDPEIAFDRYMLNFSHETEHLGQLKYLLGTWNRIRK